MAELDEPADEPNFDLFGSSGLDFFSDDELLFTETDLTEQTEQPEIGQLNDEDIDILLLKTETKTRLRRLKVTLSYLTGGQTLLTKRELLKTYESKNLKNF